MYSVWGGKGSLPKRKKQKAERAHFKLTAPASAFSDCSLKRGGAGRQTSSGIKGVPSRHQDAHSPCIIFPSFLDSFSIGIFQRMKRDKSHLVTHQNHFASDTGFGNSSHENSLFLIIKVGRITLQCLSPCYLIKVSFSASYIFTKV